MSFFQPPPRTTYDLNFPFLGIPVRVHPMFWVIALLFGMSLPTFTGIIIWVIVVFFSILIHEMGHALVMRAYGEDPYVVLHMAGGLAISASGRRDTTEQIVISLAGPFAGFLLAAIVVGIVYVLGGFISVNWLLGFIPLPSARLPAAGSIGNLVISLLLWVNVFWGLINLVPVIPLDGGRVSEQIFIKVDPWDGARKALWVSVSAGVLMALLSFFYLDSLYMGILFGLLAFQSYQMVRGGGRLF